MYIFSRTFAKRELRENKYSAKISTFTVRINSGINRGGALHSNTLNKNWKLW